MIVVRDGTEILLGRRSTKHVFMPDWYVFPGGAVDRGDARVPSLLDLHPAVRAKLERACSPARARALAMAAIRETFEETGLIIGKRVDHPLTTRSEHWREFYAAGYVPALDELDFSARAITPIGPPRRFDARFFTVDACHAHGALGGNGELEDLRWIPIDEVFEMPLASVTRLVLMLLRERLAASDGPPVDHPVPVFREIGRRHVVEHR